MFFAVIALLLLYFFLQTPIFQSWLTQKATAYLSKELNTEVKVGRAFIRFFDQIELERVFVADERKDTLLAVHRLSVGLRGNLSSAYFGTLDVEKIELEGAVLRNYRPIGSPDFSTKFIMDFLNGPDDPNYVRRAPKPFFLSAQYVSLRDVRIIQQDSLIGQNMDIWLNRANLRVEGFDVAKNTLNIPTLAIHGFRFAVVEYERTPLPERKMPKVSPGAPKAVPARQKNEATKPIAYVPPLFRAVVQELNLDNGTFSLDRNHVRPTRLEPDSVMDYEHLRVQGIQLRVDDFVADGNLRFEGELLHFAAKEDCGFTLDHAEAGHVIVCDTLTSLDNLRLQTPHSDFGGPLSLVYETYRDYNKFVDRVSLRANFAEGSKIGFRDIMYFSPPVNRNPFFISNQRKQTELSGDLSGPINRLSGQNMVLKIGNKGYLGGKFDFYDIAGGVVPRMLFFFDDLKIDIATIRDIIPGFSAPASFDKLGQISSDSLHYNLIFNTDHILTGRFRTDLGRAETSLKLVLPPEGNDKATYSGELAVFDFDVKTWTDNPNFGRTSFTISLDESSGLSQATIDAKLSGTVKSLEFKGYTYENVQLNGHFLGPRFEGELQSVSKDLDFNFAGKVDFSDQTPDYTFVSDIKRLDLKALKLTPDKDWVLSGKKINLDLHGNNLDNLLGTGAFKNILLLENGKTSHHLDALEFSAEIDAQGHRTYSAKSEVFDLNINGTFKPSRLMGDLSDLFLQSFPGLARNLGLQKNRPDSLGFGIFPAQAPNSTVNLDIHLKNSRSFTQLFQLPMDSLVDVRIKGKADAEAQHSYLNVNVPSLTTKGVSVVGGDFSWEQYGQTASYNTFFQQLSFGNLPFGAFELSGKMAPDSVWFNLQQQNTNSVLRSINLRGSLAVLGEKRWNLHFFPSDIKLFNDVWQMSDDNFVEFGNGSFSTQDFELFAENNRRITLSSRGQRGLNLYANNIEIPYLDKIPQLNQITDIRTVNDIYFHVNDVFAMQGMEFSIGIDSVMLGKYPYGFLSANASMADLKSPVDWSASINNIDEKYSIYADGLLVPKGNTPGLNKANVLVKSGEMSLDIESYRFPFSALEAFIPGISKSKGQLNGNVGIFGNINRPEMDGKVMVDSAAFQLDYLKTVFQINHQPILLTSTRIWADGDTLTDVGGKSLAFVRGGLYHSLFSNWRIDCSIESQSNDFVILDTQKGDNDLFYGKGVGKVKADFKGTFEKPDMVINLETGRDTRLFLPLEDEADAQGISFIKFKEKNKPEDAAETKPKSNELVGIQVDVNLTITEDAEVQIILDEAAGDIVKGKGTGKLIMAYSRTGDFSMSGNYRILKGEYLFTLLNLVSKPFTVQEGGTITWYGDPYAAEIDLNAKYDINASVYNFLQSELEAQGNSDLIRQSQKSSRVVLGMKLTGPLFKPNIDFGFEFPDLTGDLRSLTENKLRVLRQDPNELNRQVFGLVVFGSFFPNSDASFLLGTGLTAPVVNSFTQFLTGQFSNYLTGLAGEWFGKAVSSVDFDIAYNEFVNSQSLGGIGGLANNYGRELQVRFSSGFNNDRVVVQVGSQFGLGGSASTLNQNGFIGEDVSVEIALTANRQWRLKVFQRLEPQITTSQLRWRFGAGVTFQKEYDSFDELLHSLNKRKRPSIFKN